MEPKRVVNVFKLRALSDKWQWQKSFPLDALRWARKTTIARRCTRKGAAAAIKFGTPRSGTPRQCDKWASPKTRLLFLPAFNLQKCVRRHTLLTNQYVYWFFFWQERELACFPRGSFFFFWRPQMNSWIDLPSWINAFSISLHLWPTEWVLNALNTINQLCWESFWLMSAAFLITIFNFLFPSRAVKLEMWWWRSRLPLWLVL